VVAEDPTPDELAKAARFTPEEVRGTISALKTKWYLGDREETKENKGSMYYHVSVTLDEGGRVEYDGVHPSIVQSLKVGDRLSADPTDPTKDQLAKGQSLDLESIYGTVVATGTNLYRGDRPATRKMKGEPYYWVQVALEGQEEPARVEEFVGIDKEVFDRLRNLDPKTLPPTKFDPNQGDFLRGKYFDPSRVRGKVTGKAVRFYKGDRAGTQDLKGKPFYVVMITLSGEAVGKEFPGIEQHVFDSLEPNIDLPATLVLSRHQLTIMNGRVVGRQEDIANNKYWIAVDDGVNVSRYLVDATTFHRELAVGTELPLKEALAFSKERK